MVKPPVAMEFKFITQDQELYKRGFSDQARTVIKSQAMKATGRSRRLAGTYGKHNLGQMPPIIDEVVKPPVRRARTISREQNGLHIRAHYANGAVQGIALTVDRKGRSGRKSPEEYGEEYDEACIPPTLQLCGPEGLMAKWGFGPDDFSGLLGVELGGKYISERLCQPETLSGVLAAKKKDTFFSFLPPRYGHFPFLDNALNCLAVKVKACLLPSFNPPVELILKYYGRALNSLQEAINHATLYPVVDILCATRILALFELLFFSSFRAYEGHLAGAARLLQLLGPDAFETDYEISLLSSLAIAVNHNCSRSNVKCFFEDEPWERLFLSIATRTEKRSQWDALHIKLALAMTKLPTLFTDLSDAVIRRNTISPSDHNALLNRLRKIRDVFFAWRSDLSIVELDPELKWSDVIGQRINLLGYYITTMICVNRMIGAMSRSCRGLLEDETMALAKDYVQLIETAAKSSPALYIYVEQRMCVAESALGTTEIWRASASEESGDIEIIDQWIFDEWCSLMPRTATDGSLKTY